MAVICEKIESGYRLANGAFEAIGSVAGPVIGISHLAARGDKTAIMEAFKPSQEPGGAVAAGPEGDGGEQAVGMGDFGQPPQPQAPMRGPGPTAPPPTPGGAFPGAGNDHALTSGPGGLY